MPNIEQLQQPPSPDDLHALHALSYQLHQVPLPIEAVVELTNEIVANERAALFVARAETDTIIGQLVCTVVAEPGKRYGLVGGVVVDELVRGQGIARRLLAASYQYCAAMQCSSMELTTSRPGAEGLYLSEGFAPVSTTVMRMPLLGS